MKMPTDDMGERVEKEHEAMKKCPQCGSTNTSPNLGGIPHATIMKNGRHYSVLSYVCLDCGKEYSKEFDVTEVFKKSMEEEKE